ncbi:MAG TPA: hypothetical protein VFM97_00085 [Gammaproteobacteria bacterium]|nr:hypothetical protein [Gammaproteobacteria bacterium]
MSKKRSDTTAEPAPEPVSAPKAANRFPVTLDEFCRQLSERDRRVELIGAFHSIESRNGPQKDTAENFRARYEKFVRQPA